MIENVEKKSLLRRFFTAIFDHNVFRQVLLVMVVVRTCAFLNPVIGPFVKFTLVWSFAILIKDLFTERLFMVNRYRGILYLFLIAYGVTVLFNREENFSRNIAMLAYMVTNMMVMYAYSVKKSPGQVKKELLRFNHTFMITTFIGQLISIITFVINLKFSYKIGESFYYYGVYGGRIWGVFSNPNAASFFMVLNIMLIVTSLLIQKGNVPKWWRRFYWANSIVQTLILFLCNSRGSLLAISFYLVILPIVMGIPEVVRAGTKNARKRVIQKIAAFAVIVPLALAGAHEYAIGILPNFVIKTDYFSNQVVEGISNMDIPDSDEMVGAVDGDVALDREDFGSKFGGRYFLWQAGLKMIEDNPLFGVGNDNVPPEAYRYATRYYTNFGADVYLPGVSGGLHNLFFQIAAASGLVGLGLFCLFGAFVMIRTIRYLIWSIKNGRFNRVAASCFCILLTIILRTMTDTGIVYGIYYLGVIFWMYMSSLMYFIDLEYPKSPKPFVAMIHDWIFKRDKKAKGQKAEKILPEKEVKQPKRALPEQVTMTQGAVN